MMHATKTPIDQLQILKLSNFHQANLSNFLIASFYCTTNKLSKTNNMTTTSTISLNSLFLYLVQQIFILLQNQQQLLWLVIVQFLTLFEKIKHTRFNKFWQDSLYHLVFSYFQLYIQFKLQKPKSSRLDKNSIKKEDYIHLQLIFLLGSIFSGLVDFSKNFPYKTAAISKKTQGQYQLILYYYYIYFIQP
eukprot:TRINITY_DN2519_c2_g1_i1.p1 TRINITY_DN2519_c2_g1~~TRINITY_DN2519_c2_g1_i1.p1  ORF type:complete len:190 (+),score=-22.93 TRINITY_DN2519_c2_g1_i1:62-631(+)